MTLLATISVLNLRWRPPKIWSEEYERLEGLTDLLSKEEYLDRMQQLQVLVRTTCPSNHIDYYIFVFAISCIICSAAFSLIARSADISMWYPLILLLIPALLSFWTSRRRSTMLVRIKEFERSLKQILREFTKTDSLSRLRWSFRRPTPEDAVPSQYGSARLCLIIELAQLDPELGTYFADHNDGLPSYQTALLLGDAVTVPMSTLPLTTPPPSYAESSTSSSIAYHLGSSQTPLLRPPEAALSTSSSRTTHHDFHDPLRLSSTTPPNSNPSTQTA